MSIEDAGRVAAAIAEYDGKRIEGLASIAAEIEPSTAVLQALCDLVGGEDARRQSAASWLLRRYVSAGARLSQGQTKQVLCDLLRASHWEARLHILQMLEELAVPATHIKQLWPALIAQTTAVNKFIRAWSYHGIVVIADQHPPYRERARSLLAAADQDEAASVRARIRRIRKKIDWTG